MELSPAENILRHIEATRARRVAEDVRAMNFNTQRLKPNAFSHVYGMTEVMP